jgi:hypothetical protein
MTTEASPCKFRYKVSLLVASLILASRAVFADAFISYDDHSGTPNAGIYSSGEVFSLDVTITGTSTGTPPLASIAGFSLRFATSAASSGLFKITSDVFPASSSFTEHIDTLAAGGDLITTNGSASDLGGLQPTPQGAQGPPGVATDASYFVATITIQIDPTIAPGSYSIFNSTNEQYPSGIASGGNTQTFVPFSQTPYTITIVPEPASWSLFALGVLVSSLLARSRRDCER